jgi:hypothetical protein
MCVFQRLTELDYTHEDDIWSLGRMTVHILSHDLCLDQISRSIFRVNSRRFQCSDTAG